MSADADALAEKMYAFGDKARLAYEPQPSLSFALNYDLVQALEMKDIWLNSFAKQKLKPAALKKKVQMAEVDLLRRAEPMAAMIMQHYGLKMTPKERFPVRQALSLKIRDRWMLGRQDPKTLNGMRSSMKTRGLRGDASTPSRWERATGFLLTDMRSSHLGGGAEGYVEFLKAHHVVVTDDDANFPRRGRVISVGLYDGGLAEVEEEGMVGGTEPVDDWEFAPGRDQLQQFDRLKETLRANYG